MKKVPYGISDFKKLRTDNCVYVDKTRYIERLESYDEPYIFFLRPRRFGKSLFVSLLDYYYDKNSAGEFDSLFGDCYIGQHPTPLKNRYYILKFNFSGMNTSSKERLLETFTKSIVKNLDDFLKKYKFSLNYDTTGMPSSIFDSFLANVQHAIDGKLYILIDEYDHFANELLSFQTETFEEVVSKTGFVRKWYEILKNGTGSGLVDRIFATGVSPVTLDSLTSGFNIASDLTRDRGLHEMMGFTEEEIVWLFNEILTESADIDTLLPDVRKYYNGYRFSEDATVRLFNSDMILYYLTSYNKSGNPPRDLIDTNVASDYAKMQQLFTLRHRERNYGILQDILSGAPQSAMITRQFSLAKKFTKDDFLSLLFYLGFLTIEDFELVQVMLAVPNYVIRELYFEFFSSVLKAEADYDLDVADIRKSIIKIALHGDISDFLKIVEATLEKLSFRDAIHFDEKYVKLIMLTYLMMSKTYYVKSEYEVSEGYIDIALLKRSGVDPKFEAILEVKYLKKQDYGDPKTGNALLQETVDAARQQLAQYTKSEELREKPNLKKWVIVFAGSACVHVEELDD